ncbi:MAG: glycosyltransferase family 2 protein [Candidatus Komeilibacteria bacterium]|nr:glycosyltransferase family 2 protein [Candidatus Komeilibacteria bacterium]
MNQPRVSIIIVTYNAERYIRDLLKSVAEQKFSDFAVMIIDNQSSDQTASFISENYPHYALVKRPRNEGFSQAYNLGISWTKGEYVLCLNQDIVLEKDFLGELVNFMDQKAEAAAVSGVLLKIKVDGKNNIVDSLGLEMKKSGRVIDRHEGEEYEGGQTEEVFGVSGAAPLYRRSFLEKVKHQSSGGEYFDRDFYMYKEDIDLAWRLRHAGGRAYIVSTARAYHWRSTAKSGGTMFNQWRAHAKRSQFINYLSYRNHILTLVKNAYWSNLFRYLVPLLWYELPKLVVHLLWHRRPNNLPRVGTLLSGARRKRQEILTTSELSPLEARQWRKD